jgi:hypothetical protein
MAMRLALRGRSGLAVLLPCKLDMYNARIKRIEGTFSDGRD